MRATPVRLPALLVLTIALATSAAAQDATPTPGSEEPASVTLDVESHTQGSGGYFTLAGQTARNPTLNAPAGASVTIRLTAADDGFHNFCVALASGNQCSEFVDAQGTTASLTFTMPESGTIEYYCQPHRGAGMKGTFAVGDGAAPPTTQEPPTPVELPTSLSIETHTQGGGGYFTIAGDTARNPVLRVAPGKEITITVTAADDGYHNFCVDLATGKVCSDFVEAGGSTTTFTFTAPESGTIEYYCQPHRGAGMKGTLSVEAGAAPTPGGGTGSGVSGAAIDLATQFPNNPACAGKQASAAILDRVAGGPTLADYDNPTCSPGYVKPKEKSGADLVIPISWALIGLGIAAVVWVHKSYKP